MPNIAISEDVLTDEQVASWLAISTSGVTKLVKKGMPFIMMPGRRPGRVFLRSSIIEFLKTQERQGDGIASEKTTAERGGR